MSILNSETISIICLTFDIVFSIEKHWQAIVVAKKKKKGSPKTEQNKRYIATIVGIGFIGEENNYYSLVHGRITFCF